jgi:agmatinase
MENLKGLFSPPQNFAGLVSPYSDLQTAKVVILPVPYDGTTEWHSGTREGPRAIIDASQYLELYDIELDRDIYNVGIHTLPQVQPVLNSPEKMIDRVYQIAIELAEQAKFLVMFGGEHSLSLGMVKALRENLKDFCVLQLDAHADLRDEYLGTKYSHACVMRRIVEMCKIVQVGMRSLSREEQQFLAQNNLNPFYISGPDSLSASTDEIIASMSDNVYVSIDLDVFDPSVMPSVGTPEPGGMQWYEVVNLLRAVTLHKNIIGFDLVELCPQEGTAACAFLAAKLAYKLIGYAVS